MSSTALSGLELRSEINATGQLRLALVGVAIPEPTGDELVVRVEASPLNPADIGLLLGHADPATAAYEYGPDGPAVVLEIPPDQKAAMAARAGESIRTGNEGTGVVIRAGATATDMLGKTVAMSGGAMHAQYRLIPKADCLVLPDGMEASDRASAIVNPFTALTMLETMRGEGHSALIHSVGASNLGRMLIKLCREEGVGLVNIVRSEEQAQMLRGLGAVHICDSSLASFADDLEEACAQTGATLAFDAIGGEMTRQLLLGMERALARKLASYSRYGSSVHKQIYVYGTLDLRPVAVDRSIGMAWGVGGWLWGPRFKRLESDVARHLTKRVIDNLGTTFASHYSARISLEEVLEPDILRAYARRSTGEKYLICPQKPLG